MDIRGRLILLVKTICLTMASCAAISCSKDDESDSRQERADMINTRVDATYTGSDDSNGAGWKLDAVRLHGLSNGSVESKSRTARSLVFEAIEQGSFEDLATLIDLLVSIVPSHEFSAHSYGLVLRMLHKDSARAVNWLLEHEGHPQFAPAYKAFGEGLTRYAPEMIIEVAQALGHEGLKGREVVSGVVLQIARGESGVRDAINLRQQLVPFGFDPQVLDAMIVDGGPRSEVIELMYRGEL